MLCILYDFIRYLSMHLHITSPLLFEALIDKLACMDTYVPCLAVLYETPLSIK